MKIEAPPHPHLPPQRGEGSGFGDRRLCEDRRRGGVHHEKSDLRKVAELVSIGTLSRMIEIPENTLRKWIWQRQIPYHKVGKLIRFSLEEIRSWYQAQRKGPLTPSVVRDRIVT